ncbi:MAG: methyltransferase domain-containing protein [bacterium]
MKTNKCRVCGHDLFKAPLLKLENMPKAAQYLPDAKTLVNDNGIRLEVCQCSGCGLVQLNNKPVPYYREVIRAAAFSPEMRIFRAKQFAAFVSRYSLKGEKVIEIGCGHGEYLEIMREQGVEAFGLEHLAKAVAQCKKKGLKTRQGFIDKASTKILGAPFVAFFMMSFLEHLPEPNTTLVGIRNNLDDGGFGLVEVPNFDLILQQNLFAEFIGDHLFYFTKETLARTLELNGFDVIECQEVWHNYIISAVVKKRRKLELNGLKHQQTCLKFEIQALLDRYQEKQVAVWGAGHQALALIALMGIAKKIKYVVDSATFKQGKYTPATHLPIVGPDKLDSDPAKAIIVVAASYSAEVVGIIKQKYGNKVEIFVIKEGTIKTV